MNRGEGLSVRQRQDCVYASFEDESTAESDFLIAADGIHSTIRSQLRPASQVRFAGYSAWRGLARESFPYLSEATSLLMMGCGCQAGVFPCGRDHVYWFATQNTPANPFVGPGTRKITIQSRFEDWPSPLPEIIEATPAESILENDICDLDLLQNWGVGRITFVGDAIHAVTPDLGQGAALGLEDAVVLGRLIQSGTGIEEALREYEVVRKQRTAWIARYSRWSGRLLQAENPIAIVLRQWLFSAQLVYRCQEPLFDRLFEFS